MLNYGRHHQRIAIALAGLLLTALSGVARAQSQAASAPSVAEAARRAREQKKNSAKPARTLTNDDLPASPAAPPVTANEAGVPASPATAGDTPAPAPEPSLAAPADPGSDEQAKQKKAETAAALERAKKDLAQAKSELDVMQRKAVLDRDSYYSKPDFASDKAGKANLDAEAREISDKKQAVDALTARILELQALAGEPATAEPDKNPPPR